MKIKGWHLIVLAITIFFLDFFTLGNRSVIDNPITNQIANVIGILCVLVFIFGVIKALLDFSSKIKVTKTINRKQEEEQGIRATGVEIGLRRLLAILQLIIILPMGVLFPIFGWLLALPNLLFVLYLFINRKYHLVFDGFLVILGSLFYFFIFPTNPSYFSLYKSIELTLCPGHIEPFMAFLSPAGPLAITKYFFLLAALFLLAGDIVTRIKVAHKRRLNAISLLIICLVLLLLPFLYVPGVALGHAGNDSVGSTSGFDPWHFKTSNASYNMSYDKTLHTYTFTAEMVNQDGSSSASITTIFVDGEEIPITKENNALRVDNGMIADGKITVAPGQTATITLVSPKPFFVFTLFEGNYHYSTSFIK